MVINEFVKSFCDQFEETDTSSINEETIFRDIDEWDSLTALSIIAMVDEMYNVKLTGDDIKNSQKIKDIYEIIKLKS